MNVLGCRADVFGSGYGPLHPFGPGCEYQISAECTENHASFDGHCLRHCQGQAVAAGCTDKGECNTGVAACRFNNFHSGLQATAFFSVPNHRRADAAFHAVGWVATFNFRVDCSGEAGRQSIDADEGAAANGQ
jgi:hypothetical protein